MPRFVNMRKIANLTTPKDDIVRVMIYDDGSEVYLFLYDSEDDGPCCADFWFGTISEAEEVAANDFGIVAQSWNNIPDPTSGSQHDWINPKSRAEPPIETMADNSSDS